MTNIIPAEMTTSDSLLRLLGSFWSEIYQDDGQLRTILDGISALQWQSAINMQETEDCIDWSKTPVWHREQWYRLVLRDGQQVSTGIPYRYGTELYFGPTDGIERSFGDYRVTFTSYAVSTELAKAACIVNQMRNPTVWLTNGIDFYIDPTESLIYFRTDPLTDDRFQKELVSTDDGHVQQTIIWLHQADIDKQILQTNLGTALKLWANSSERYRELLVAVAEARVGGTTKTLLQRIITAVTQMAFAKTTETVLAVVPEARQLLVLTDKNVYTAPATATAMVAVADQLSAGDAIFDIAEIITFRHGTVPAWLKSVTLGTNFLSPAISGPLTFVNADVPLLLEDQAVRFSIGGTEEDVAAFWASVDAFGESSGVTLGERLDLRGPGYSPLRSQFLPETINPLEFLAQNVFRENVWGLRLKLLTDADWLPVYWSQLLRELTPPHTSVLLFAELDALDSTGFLGATDTLGWELTPAEVITDESLLGVTELLNPMPMAKC